MNDEAILHAISDCVGIRREELQPDKQITDIVQDSMDMVEMIAVLSNRFNMRFDTSQMQNVKTVGDVIAYVKANQGKAAGGGKF